jgi:hypothetical protein
MIIKFPPKKPKDSLPLYDDIRKRKGQVKEKDGYYCEPQIPQLPKWTNKIYSSQGEQVNLFNLTCTCKDYSERKAKYTGRDIRLCCKHIYYKLTGSAISKHINSLYKNLSHAAAIFKIESFCTYKIDRRDIYFGYKEDSNWIQVFFPVDENNPDSYARFSFSPELSRWSNGINPVNAWKIEHMIKKIIDS